MAQQPTTTPTTPSTINAIYQPSVGTPLEYGSKIRLFVTKQDGRRCGYVGAYFLDTDLPPSLVIQSSLAVSAVDIMPKYADLTQSMYFKIVDPSDLNGQSQIKKQVRFGDSFQLIPFNSTTGSEIDSSFEQIATQSKLRDKQFTFSISTTITPPSPSLGPKSLQQQPPQQPSDDKVVRYGVSNITLNIIKSPSKKSDKVPGIAPIEFAKHRGASSTEGFLTSFAETITSAKGDPVAVKPITFTIRAADEPLLSLHLFDTKMKSAPSSTTTAPPITGPLPGTLINSIPIHTFGQHHVIYTGQTDKLDDITMVLNFRDIPNGQSTVPLSTLPVPPLNLHSNMASFAPPTTTQAFYEYSDDNPNNNKEPESIVRSVQMHGSQLSINLPIRYTRIMAPLPKEPFRKGQSNVTFSKIDPPSPSLLLCFIAFFLLAYRIFTGLRDDVFVATTPFIDTARYLGPFVIFAFLAVSYIALFHRNVGHSMKFSSPKSSKDGITTTNPPCYYIMQFLQPQEFTTNKDIILAHNIQSPFTFANPTLSVGYPTAMDATLKTAQAAAVTRLAPTIAPKPTATATPPPTPKVSTAATFVSPLSHNPYYQYQMQLQESRLNVNENTLNLFQILDTIRTACTFTDGSITSTASLATNYTLPQASVTALDDTLNGINLSYDGQTTNIKSAIKHLRSNGLANSSELIAALREYNKNVSYSLTSPHTSKGDKVEVKQYYPFIFKAIRESHLLNNEDFVNAWTFGLNNLPAASTGAGRSGALFMRSRDQRFIFKTMSGADMATLHAVISDYGQYITTHSSMLMRLLGVFRVKNVKTGKKEYFLLANNAFYLPDYIASHYKLVSKYDLKGRTPKRDSNQRLDVANDGVWKDLQLNRVFPVHHTLREQVVKNIDSDVQWLQQHDCIDYSLLVGVAENEQLALLAEEANAAGSNFQNAARELLANLPNIPSNVEQHRSIGIPPHVKAQDDNAEVFFIAIVDFLARFNNMMKKTAHAMKSLRWTDDELSTVNSQFYGDRFNRYIKVVFPPNGAVLVRTMDDLQEYFRAEANALAPQQQAQSQQQPLSLTNHKLASPTVSLIGNQHQKTQYSDQTIAMAEHSLKQLPDTALKALEPGARSPGSLIVTSSGKHVIIVPQGVDTAPKSLIERSKVAAELSKLTSQASQLQSPTD